MPLSWNKIKSRSLAFSREWAEASSEKGEAQSFWNDFFQVFGVSRPRVASFEQPIKEEDNRGASQFCQLLGLPSSPSPFSQRGRGI